MSETTEREDVGNLKPTSPVMELLAEKFHRLPETDKKLFAYGSVYLGINGAFGGLIANSFFRRILKVTQARFASSLPMAVLPFLSTVALFQTTVSQPLLSGDLNCQSCAGIRGGLLGVVVGGLYPVGLALPVNAGLATRYNTTPMPEKGKVIQFMVKITKPVLRKMVFVFLLQAACGYYLGTVQYRIYKKMLELPSADGEDREAIGFNNVD